jgi:ABC-2 type transport system permease protein
MVAKWGAGHWLLRLGPLWWAHARLDLLFVTRSSSTFLSYLLADMVAAVGEIGATLLLAERFQGIGGWQSRQVTFMLGYALLVNGLLAIFAGYNVWFISRRIGRGQLDHLLLQPQPLWLALATEGFTPFSGWASLAPGLVLLGWSLWTLPGLVTLLWLVVFAGNLIASAVIGICFVYLWSCLAFWAPVVGEEIAGSAHQLLSQLQPYPLDGLPGLLVAGLVTVVPAGLIAWLPSRVLLGLVGEPWQLAATPLAALLILLATIWLFRMGMRHYARDGASRYLDFGHRR